MSVVENAKEQLLSSGSWSIDPAHSTVEFRVKQKVIQTVRGRFRDFEGAIVAGEAPSVSGTIAVASLETLHAERDAHLRSRDFSDVERYPEIVFQGAGFGCPCHGSQFDNEGNRTAGPAARALDRYEFSIRDGRLILGKTYSVAKVQGTGAHARIYRYGLAGPGQHVDGPEAWFYPVQPSQF